MEGLVNLSFTFSTAGDLIISVTPCHCLTTKSLYSLDWWSLCRRNVFVLSRCYGTAHAVLVARVVTVNDSQVLLVIVIQIVSTSGTGPRVHRRPRSHKDWITVLLHLVTCHDFSLKPASTSYTAHVKVHMHTTFIHRNYTLTKACWHNFHIRKSRLYRQFK